MKQKTRYNIKLAQKKGVVVRASSDIETFHRLMQETGGRDQFGIHSLAYYQKAYELFQPNGACTLLLADVGGQPLAGLMVFTQGERAWYLFGASSNELREYMPTYLLQWEAIRWARERGCKLYDLWGVPDVDETTLESEFNLRSDGLWGVYRNKRGYGGSLVRSAGPWDRIYSTVAYKLYLWWITHRSSPAG
jgi:lipid II:glycine glycyltransferase (peptidoglycan interpeptide bridge formation enzyme)